MDTPEPASEYRTKAHIVGGGLWILEGETVNPGKLGPFAEILKGLDAIEEVASRSAKARPKRPDSYMA